MRLRLIVATCAFLALPATAGATLIVNGGFEDPGFDGSFVTYPNGSTALTGWLVDGAGIVHVGSFWQHASGNHSVELNLFGSGGISQTVATVPGQVYALEFDLAGQTNLGPTIKEMQIFWDGALVNTSTFDVSGHTLQDMGWEHRVVPLPAATESSTVLRFLGSVPASGDGGAGLDNVTLVAVPEPDTLLLLLIGAALAAARRWQHVRR